MAKQKKIDYEGMGDYFCISSITLRRYEKNDPSKFRIMLFDYEQSLKRDDDKTEENDTIDFSANAVLMLNFKGGVGKSTLANIFGEYLGDAVILNTDIAQNSSEINSCPTVDYDEFAELGVSISGTIKNLRSKYNYVIVDTASGASEFLGESVDTIKNIIVPLTIGSRSRETTLTMLEVMFGSQSNRSGDYKIFFVVNMLKAKSKNEKLNKHRDQSLTKLYDELMGFKANENVSLTMEIGTLDKSDAIATSENTGKSIFNMYKQNRDAYKSIASKAKSLCSKIEDLMFGEDE